MELRCENCGEPIPENHYNLETRIADCPNCDAIFAFDLKLVEAEAGQHGLLVPKNVMFTSTAMGISISFAWLNWRSPLFMAAGLLVMGTPIMLLNVVGGEGESVNPLIMLISVPVVLFGIWLIYYSLALFMNKTHIQLDHHNLRVRHGPIPLRKSTSVTLNDIDVIEERAVKYGNAYSTSTAYDVVALMQDGTENRLLDGLNDESQVNFIIQQLKSYVVVQGRNHDAAANLTPHVKV